MFTCQFLSMKYRIKLEIENDKMYSVNEIHVFSMGNI